MYSSYSTNSYITESDLIAVFSFCLVENAVALAVLLPYPFQRHYWVRTLFLQIVFGGWLFFMFLGAMHSNTLYLLNVLGVFLINILILILMISSKIADIRNKDRYENL